MPELKNNKQYMLSLFHDHEMVYNIREKGYARDIRWIKVAAKADKLSVDFNWNPDWYDNYIREMEQIINALNVAYGNNWDMNLTQVNTTLGDDNVISYNLDPILLYPEFTIENSEGESTEIKNLFVTFNLKKNKDFDEFTFDLAKLYGTRAGYQFSHYSSGYMHSHLQSNKINTTSEAFYLKPFCTGGDAEIDDIMSEISANGFEENMFGLFLTMIDTLVHWESLEGVPYFKMRKIVQVEENIRIAHGQSKLKSLYEAMEVILRDGIDCDFVYSSGRYKIKQNEKLNASIRSILIDCNDNYLQKKLLVKKHGDYYYAYKQPVEVELEIIMNNISYTEVVDSVEVFDVPFTFINGRKIKIEIEPFEGETVDINEYKVYPKFLEYVTEKMEKQLYERAVRSSVLKRISQH